MSRILDALKKAEQEKPLQNLASAVVTTDGPGLEHKTAVAPSLIQEVAPEMTVEAILESAPRPDPNPDSNPVDKANPIALEEFRTLRSRLFLMRKHQTLQKLLITSPLPQEGKTFISASLAQSIAKLQDSRVLVIDGDLRVSTLHRILGAALGPGLSEYLSGTADLKAVLRRSTPDNLFLITAGERSANPTELLGNGRFDTLIKRLAPAFDWIILDSPPAVPVSDAKLLAQFCDGVLMLVRAGVTPVDLAQKACQEFPKNQLLGVILNQAEAEPGYGYYYSTTKADELCVKQ